ncbi:MAG: DNA alkylation repair protein [Candidatus Fermentibacteraceae bacterium]|nr:DNA alkylation repair protein [Candidatus Fermentibacteraceae bacterium]MBN2608096.1 DNA alkylation repair protein [Candidatus Fermentibacteraceae bacterium]
MSEITDQVKRELREFAEPDRAESHQRFFKTGPDQYGEGDMFLGIRVPNIRTVVKRFRGLSTDDCLDLLSSPWHEERLFSLMMMVDSFRRGDESTRREICGLYMENTRRINNWDLVDLSAPGIPGAWFYGRDRTLLLDLALSRDLWERRISIIATQYFIVRDDFADTLRISGILLKDEHDLIHKAVGWMLREVGKRDLDTEERFLRKHYADMPRTMLRYAIEKFPEERRQMYLRGAID